MGMVAVREAFIVHVGGTRGVTWSIDQIVQIHACTTWGVALIQAIFFHRFLWCLTYMTTTIHSCFFQFGTFGLTRYIQRHCFQMVQPLQSQFDLRHRYVSGRVSIDATWWSLPVPARLWKDRMTLNVVLIRANFYSSFIFDVVDIAWPLRSILAFFLHFSGAVSPSPTSTLPTVSNNSNLSAAALALGWRKLGYDIDVVERCWKLLKVVDVFLTRIFLCCRYFFLTIVLFGQWFFLDNGYSVILKAANLQLLSRRFRGGGAEVYDVSSLCSKEYRVVTGP